MIVSRLVVTGLLVCLLTAGASCSSSGEGGGRADGGPADAATAGDGAGPGDRLCVFDRPRHQYGCEVITSGDDRLTLEHDPTWTPLIQLSPVSSTTFTIQVSNLPPLAEPLKARRSP